MLEFLQSCYDARIAADAAKRYKQAACLELSKAEEYLDLALKAKQDDKELPNHA